MDNQLAELPEVAPPERLLIYPSWGDPGFSLAAYQVNPTVITLVAVTPKLVAQNNPRRWAIGFQDTLVGPSSPRVGIMTDPSRYGHTVNNTLTGSWFTIFNYGPMVSMEWWALSTGGGDFLLYEIELQ